jgi:hypothetical protein
MVRLTAHDYAYLLGHILAFSLASQLYAWTLRGRDVVFLKQNVAAFGAMMAASVVITLLMTLIPIHFRLKVQPWVRVVSLVVGWALLGVTALSDLGATIQRHGQFNLIGFVALWVPGFFLSLVIRGCVSVARKVQPRKCLAMLLTTFILCYYQWAWLSATAVADWGLGLGGQLLDGSEGACKIELGGTPWISILPDNAFNFLFGSYECIPPTSFSTLNDSGLLSITCDQKFAEIVEYPDFLAGRDEPWPLWESGILDWQAKTAEKERRYSVAGYSTLTVKAEYFQVFCGEKENYYVQHQPSPDTLKRLEAEERAGPRYNLLVFQIDALSRAHFFRKMKRTVETLNYLNSTEEIEVFQMFKVVSNGFNTEENTKAIYTGSQFSEGRAGRAFWDVFQRQGNAVAYINGFCEDWSQRFLDKPQSGVDHFVFLPWCHPEYHPINNTFSPLQGVNSMKSRCISGKHVHSRMFDYFRQFWSNYLPWGKTVLMPLQEAHEPSMSVVKSIDPDFSELLLELHRGGQLKETVVVISSDHGQHMSPYFIFSEAGQLEHKMPTLFYLLPRQLLDLYPELRQGLTANEQEMVTHYDTHWTFLHLSSLPEFGGDAKSWDRELNLYTEVWDCEANSKAIRDIWYFRGRYFANTKDRDHFSDLLKRAFQRIEECIDSYAEAEPEEDPMLHSIWVYADASSDEQVKVKVKVQDVFEPISVDQVMKDKDSYDWFEDAIQDIMMENWLHSEDSSYASKDALSSYLNNYQADLEVWKHFKAPQSGRYKFGRSIFSYSEQRPCLSAGAPECPCK